MTHEEAARLCLLAGVIKPKQASEAKAALPEGSSHQVDVTLHLQGSVVKSESTPDAEISIKPSCNAWQRGVLAEVLRRLDVDTGKLKRALRAALRADPVRLVEDNQQLIDLVEQIAEAHRQTLPETKTTKPGRAATVHAMGSVEFWPRERSAA